jgi:predicted secreted hydrolase
VSRKGEGRGRASHYYSLTRLRTEGSLIVRGETLPVSGWSWMDHEFGSTELASDQVGWDWWSLQFEDGTEKALRALEQFIRIATHPHPEARPPSKTDPRCPAGAVSA